MDMPNEGKRYIIGLINSGCSRLVARNATVMLQAFSITILVALAIYLLGMAHIISNISLLAVFAGALLLRLIAYHYRWQLSKL